MFLVAAVLLAQVSVPAELRTLTVTAVDEKGSPVTGLEPREIAVLENGVARPLVEFALDRRPLTVLFFLDTSQAVAAIFRLNLREPLVAFFRGLPEGAAYSLWTTGDRPTKLVDFTKDAEDVVKALNRVFPQGGNTLLDAILEATPELKKREGERSVVVILTAAGEEFSSRFRQQVVEGARGNADIFMAVQLQEGGADFETQASYDYVLGGLTRATGGFYDRVLSSMAVKGALEKLAAELGGQYRLSYSTPPDLKERKLEVSVARPGVKIRVGRVRP